MRETKTSRIRSRARTLACWVALGLAACTGGSGGSSEHAGAGPNGGHLLRSDDVVLELALFELGTAPEFRAWATRRGEPVSESVSLAVELHRLGGRMDRIDFELEEGVLRGRPAVAEPHSFEVAVELVHEGEKHAWRYESFEGRTRIAPDVAAGLGLATEVAGPAALTETVPLYGRVRPHPEHVREIRARFDGMLRGVDAEVGSRVAQGDRLLAVESDESLRVYRVLAPISGVVTQRDANPGEHTAGRRLLTITDLSKVWVDLSVFPSDRDRVRPGAAAVITPATGGEPVRGVVSTVEILADARQAVVARVVLDAPGPAFLPGTFVRAEVVAEEHPVPLAVRRDALQTFRGHPVVYAQVGDEYEVRMLEVGHQGGEWVEVLGGLEPGTRYVTANSHLIKAELGASGASHDH